MLVLAEGVAGRVARTLDGRTNRLEAEVRKRTVGAKRHVCAVGEAEAGELATVGVAVDGEFAGEVRENRHLLEPFVVEGVSLTLTTIQVIGENGNVLEKKFSLGFSGD